MKKLYKGNERRSNLNKLFRDHTTEDIDRLRMIYSTLTHCDHFPKNSICLLEQAAKDLEKSLYKHGISYTRLEEIKNAYNFN
jgi:hypothetical protein